MRCTAARTHLLARFEEFRRKGLFTDGWYNVGEKEERVHKLVLARSSLFFAQAFQVISDEKLPVVLNLANKFDDIVTFMYTGSLNVSKGRDTGFLQLYAMACFYGVEDLAAMMKDAIDLELLGSEKWVGDREAVLDWLAGCRIVSEDIDDYPPELEPVIREAKRRAQESQMTFIDRLLENWEYYVTEALDHLCQAVTPFLLAKAIQESGMPDEKIIELIDRYTQDLVQSDEMSYFQDLVDWSKPGKFRLFTRSKLDWVAPKLGRAPLSELLTVRRETIRALTKEVQTIRSQKKPRPVTRWFLFQWCGEIGAANQVQRLPPVPILDYIGTLGSLVQPLDVVTFGFIRPDCSSSLGQREHDRSFCEDTLFNRIRQPTARYFAADPLGAPKDFRIGMSFNRFQLRVDVVELFLHPKQTLDESACLVCHGMKEKSAAWQVEGSRSDPQVVRFTQTSSIAPLVSIVISFAPEASDNPYPLIVRANRLEVTGRFVPYT